ncbi:DUF3999 domain-containing protein [Yokenella regensburgei]|uniref:DUF3999 domain-containing protein n=1 Tax=Yokenella regensburgei TaxID=158877 RepID=UPI003F1429AA
MKWMRYIAVGALLSVASSGFARTEDTPETPQDYGWGKALATTESSPWYRVNLPVEVYEQSAWPDLRDVRVFNHQGERVPFSLEKQKLAPANAKTTELRIFPLTTSPVESVESEGAKGERIWLRSPNGYEITLEGERVEGIGKSYLLALPDSTDDPFTVSQLRLGWDKPTVNWQGKASVYSSSNMQEWVTMKYDVPLMDIASGDDRLALDKINLDLRMGGDSPRYLLVVFDKPQLPFTLTQASVVEEQLQEKPAQVSLPGWATKVSADEVHYQWTQPQPLTALSVRLDYEGVLPVAIAWRPTAQDAWRPLKKELIFNLNNQVSDDIVLPGQPVQAIRLTTVNAHLPEALPQVEGLRERQDLIFNAQGNGPFILAWGNKAATEAALPLDSLIPARLRSQHAPDTLPQAMGREAVKLGGESRLSAVSPAERESQWYRFLVWGVLVFGALALGWMALRIWRDVQKDKAS